MDRNQKVAIIALIVAVLMILAAIGIFAYEMRNVKLPSFNLSDLVMPIQSRLKEMQESRIPPQIPLPESTSLPVAGQGSTSPPFARPGSTLPPPPVQKEPGYSTVFFGSYQQGNGIEPIEWYVLERQADRCLLISRYVLDYLKYHGTEEPVTWETCGLRAWLNSEFLKIAFRPEELSAILVTETDNSVGDRIFHIDGGNNTEDRVFLLSREEAEQYFPTDEERICAPTEACKQYAVAGFSHWWLRSPGHTEKQAQYVHYTGGFIGGAVNLNYTGIRPAIWVAADSLTID